MARPNPAREDDNYSGELHPEVQARLARMESGIEEIKTALIGSALGHKGIIPRLDVVENKCDQHDRKLLVWGAILSAAGLVTVYLKEYILRKAL